MKLFKKKNILTHEAISYNWLPAGDENLASSRLRCYYLHNELYIKTLEGENKTLYRAI